MIVFGKKHTGPAPSAPAPRQSRQVLPPVGSIVQALHDISRPGHGVIATANTPGRVIGDGSNITKHGQVLVEWYGGVTTVVNVYDLKTPWFEPARETPPTPQPRQTERVRTIIRETVTTPLDPDAPMDFTPSRPARPGEKTWVEIVREEPIR